MKALTLSLFVLAAILFATPLQARPQLHFDLGITTLDLGSLRKANNDYADNAKKSGSDVTHKEELWAPYLDLGINFMIKNQFYVGPEFGYIQGSEDRTQISSGGFDTQTSFTPGMIPLLVKFGWQGPVQDKGFYAGADLGVGYGIFWITSTINSTQVLSYTYGASGLMSELNGRFGYEWKHFNVGLVLGYRYAYFNDVALISSTDNNFSSPKVGDKYKDGASNPQGLNMSGAKGQLELGIRF